MSVSPTVSAKYCYGGSCNRHFVTLRGPNGQPVDIDGHGCFTDCGACVAPKCPAIACAVPGPLTTTGVTRVWDGAAWSTSTCGSANLVCEHSECAPAGQYLATMCAHLDASASPICSALPQNTVCKDFAFDWPPPGGSATLRWTIGEADAGTPDGDGGQACFTSTVPPDFKSCTTSADCTVKVHQTDCCGTRHYIGVNAAVSSVYDACESTWDRHFPACGCASGLPTTDDGLAVVDPSTVVASCLTPLGAGPKTCSTMVVGGAFDAGGR